MTSQNLSTIQDWLPAMNYYGYRQRLETLGIPKTAHRVSILYWAEEVMKHCFTIEDYIQEFSETNAHRDLRQLVNAGFLTKVWHDNTIYYVTHFALSPQSPCVCSHCGDFSIKKLIKLRNKNV
ncbi:hypothetical protein WKG86_18405 [Pantoea agglomerans]|jgi:hypothetical protein|uniref:hypothetical protein n=1 Tax=Pantoea TaxID=53335 RepID=UPI00277DF2C4|nr:hypothetical protein [Pantoea ananatis]MDQ1224192.1 hypothetical protein [Pantoea ananatis]MDR6091739.1 hypothetical protein [Pantoea ananatis]MDU6078596.1 hypothetical protein [Pantoea sp.]